VSYVHATAGVFSSACGTDVDHAIVLEGYGTDSAVSPALHEALLVKPAAQSSALR